MYQREMFARVIKTQGKLGDGLYGEVHAISEEWVVKYARCKDGTLNYLEWCYSMQQAGMGMKGMPEIDRIVHLDGGYMVTMRRYAKTFSQKDGGSIRTFMHETWFVKLREAYDRHLCMLRGTDWRPPYGDTLWTDGFNDIHGGNIMWDDREDRWIVTDPDSRDYRRPRPELPDMVYAEPEAQPKAESVPVLPRAEERPKFKAWTPPKHTTAALNKRMMDDLMNMMMVPDVRMLKPRVFTRLATSDLRKLPDVQIADAPPAFAEWGPGMAFNAADMVLKVRRANTEEKREHYKKNPPPIQWYHHGRRW